MQSGSWQIWVDTGGTFTDCIGISPEGEFRRLKVLSNSSLRGKILKHPDHSSMEVQLNWPVERNIYNNYVVKILGTAIERRITSVDFVKNTIRLNTSLPHNYEGSTIEISTGEEVPVLAARLLTGVSLGESFPALEMKLGSTRGTNAILEKKGARTAFIVTKGFKDLLLIGNQQRSDLFALQILKEKPLYNLTLEADERILSNGQVFKRLAVQSIREIIQQLRRKKIESVAIALLNSYRNADHEIALAKALQKAGFLFVSVSHQLSGQLKILPRAETTVVNAYLDPIIRQYVTKIQSGLSGARLKIMTSAGGLLHAENFHPKDSLLSGPAGGVVGAVTAARLSGHERIITFDMGGTSTDVSLYNKSYDYRYESKVAGLKILSPSLSIETIAAGGGSICDFDGFRFTVGPHSAGASPGPACYGAGGPLTITDVNLLLGRVDEARFSIPLHRGKSEEALRDLLQKVKKTTRQNISPKSVLESLIQIANEKMAEAIRKVSVQYGHDPAEFTLLSFGGAGGQHAIALANLLGMKQVVVPYDAGLLSAYGIGHAEISHFEEQLILKKFAFTRNDLPSLFESLHKKGIEFLVQEGYPSSEIKIQKQLLFLRFEGQESTLEVDYLPGANILESFQRKYESVFGHWLADGEVELESVKVIVSVTGYQVKNNLQKSTTYWPSAFKKQKLFTHGATLEVLLFQWEDLKPGALVNGPAIVTSRNSTTVVDDGWTFHLDENNNALIKGDRKVSAKYVHHSKEARLELFANRFTSVAQEMGALLQRTSFSVNVKERLDFSCALLDADGYLVVNAPHIPVHLGSLGVCVREVLKVIPLQQGDVVVTNHPAYGGSHLPDVTLIKGVFFEKKLVGYVANRAHHAEIGGKKPGSMPADATQLEEEGVIIAPIYLVTGGEARWEAIRKIFNGAIYPTRLLSENLADLNGALAAVNLGERALNTLCGTYGFADVTLNMKALRSYAAKLLRHRLAGLSAKSYSATERLDDGSVLRVRATLTKNKMVLDFTGSSDVHPGNLNATKAIVQSTVLYALRLLVNKPIPMNEGLLDRVKIILPYGLLDPFSSPPRKKSGYVVLPAVVGGNTEVSQRLTDTLLKAFGLAACSQGTMNNLLFGNDRFGYYETICGGTGAGPGFAGTDAVHQHMTNTRITDPELLELRYPVRLEKFQIRKNSGGGGKWPGGDGVIREIVFTEVMDVNILSQHRKEKPYGMKGGQPGKNGTQKVIRKNGATKKLSGMDSVQVNAGDKLIIQTPGGGGWGKK